MTQQEGAIAIVTGGGSGIGQETVWRFAEAGVKVLSVDRNGAALTETLANPRCSDRVEQLEMDVTGKQAPAAIMAHCRSVFGVPTYLINNAGVSIARQPGQGNTWSVGNTTDEDLEDWLDGNFRTAFRMSRAFVSEPGGPGRAIVNLSSILGFVGGVGSAAYSSSKAALLGLTRQMTADYTPLGIRINAIAPGVIATPATYERLNSNTRYRQLSLQQVPLGRAGTPADVAAVICFLCSQEAGYICGEVLVVDGGWTATRYIQN